MNEYLYAVLYTVYVVAMCVLLIRLAKRRERHRYRDAGW